jgi:hypothetical protein
MKAHAGFLAIIWFGSSPTPFFLQLIALFLSLHVWGRRGEDDIKPKTLAPLVVCVSREGGGGGGGGGGKEVWTRVADPFPDWIRIQ